MKPVFWSCITASFLLIGGVISAQPPQPTTQAPVDHVAFSGIVVDESGNPIPDVQVHLMQNDGRFSSHCIQDTDQQGSFTHFLKNEAAGVVFANLTSNEEERVVDYAVVEGASAPLRLVLKKDGRKLAGVVVDTEGQPVPNALIGLSANTREGAGKSTYFRLGLVAAGMRNVKADAQGRFAADGLPALPIIVWAARPGDKAGLFKQYQMSMKKPVLDLGDGDILDYQAVVDRDSKQLFEF